jgi:hypothetical protein
LITLALLAIALLTVLLAVMGLRDSLGDIRHLKAPWLILAIGFELASCLSFVVIFRHFFDRTYASTSSTRTRSLKTNSRRSMSELRSCEVLAYGMPPSSGVEGPLPNP